MTLQSCPNSSEEVAPSPSCSTSTSSTDVYPLPYSIGDKEIVLNNDERSVVSVVTDNEFLGRGTTTNISVENSTNVDVGNRTVFNGDVTIYQHINGHLPEIQNGPIEHGVDCNKNVRVIPATPTVANVKPDSGPGILKRHLNAIMITLTVLVVISAIVLITMKFVRKKAPDRFVTIGTTEVHPETTTKPTLIHYIFNRTIWGGRDPLYEEKIDEPVELVIVKHTGGATCDDVSSCFAEMKNLQNTDVGEGEPDIRYNFLIGGDANIYEGRGWGVKNAGMNNTIDIAYMGNFNLDVPTIRMASAGPYLVVKGGAFGKLDPARVKVVCHNQTEDTDSPGVNLYKEVIKWMFYSDEIINASRNDYL